MVYSRWSQCTVKSVQCCTKLTGREGLSLLIGGGYGFMPGVDSWGLPKGDLWSLTEILMSLCQVAHQHWRLLQRWKQVKNVSKEVPLKSMTWMIAQWGFHPLHFQTILFFNTAAQRCPVCQRALGGCANCTWYNTMYSIRTISINFLQIECTYVQLFETWYMYMY